jgi:hypothetical protein
MKPLDFLIIAALVLASGCKDATTAPEKANAEESSNQEAATEEAATTGDASAPRPAEVCVHIIGIMQSEMPPEAKAQFANKMGEMQSECTAEVAEKQTEDAVKYAIVAKCMMQATDRAGMDICKELEDEE